MPVTRIVPSEVFLVVTTVPEAVWADWASAVAAIASAPSATRMSRALRMFMAVLQRLSYAVNS